MKIRVSLIDPNPDDRVYLQELMLGMGSMIDLATYETLGAEQLSSRPAPQVLILDVSREEDQSLKRLSEAQSLRPGCAVILAASYLENLPLADCLRAGAQDVLDKNDLGESVLEKAIVSACSRQELANERDRLNELREAAMANHGLGYLLIDQEGRVQKASENACLLLGIAASALEGKRSPVPTDQSSPMEMAYKGPDGARKTLQYCTTGLPGDLALRCLTLRDVSERYESIESQKLETLSRVCFGVAHEFNNLLAITRTKSDFLETLSSSDPVWAAHILDLKRACDRGSHLVSKLMTFYGRKSTSEESVDLGRYLRSALPDLRAICGSERELLVSGNLSGCIAALPESSLGLILRHLIENAKDASPAGSPVELKVACQNLSATADSLTSEPADTICISIRDRGRGIPPGIQNKIFDPFFTTKETAAGRGLGLSVVANLIRAVNGSIEFESRMGAGSEFRVYIPRAEKEVSAQPQDSASQAAATVSPASGEAKPKPRILVVDDESIIRFSVQSLLEMEGYEVSVAENGLAALALLEEHSFEVDILLTDMNMPGLNGQELVLRAMHLRPGLKTVMMSGFGSGGLDKEWLEQRNVSFIPKPFRRKDLQECMQRVTNAKLGKPSTLTPTS